MIFNPFSTSEKKGLIFYFLIPFFLTFPNGKIKLNKIYVIAFVKVNSGMILDASLLRKGDNLIGNVFLSTLFLPIKEKSRIAKFYVSRRIRIHESGKKFLHSIPFTAFLCSFILS